MSRLYCMRQFTFFTPSNPGYLWSLQVKLEPVVNLLLDKGKLMDFLLQRKECKMVILSVCSQSKFKCVFCILKVQYFLFINTHPS